MARFNYKRGAERLYLALSVLWIGSVTISAFANRPRFHERDKKGNLIPSFEEFTNGQNQSMTEYWITSTATAIGPPIGGYVVLFIVIPWIGRGFRSTQL